MVQAVSVAGRTVVVVDSRRFDPPRVVEVERDGVWYRGLQDGWVRWPDGTWRASVEYSVAPGIKYSQSVPAARVRPVDG
ncbi:MAG: hypothetical protein HOV66_13570 [Streptomycetaceae bacterium]|nr:hypothetical protein [Streptomycetaceae bacterium]